MRIYIIRHGETSANKDGLFQGWTDFPLNENGVKLAQITSEAFKDVKFDACFSSPLKRSLETAKIMLEGSGNKDVKIIIDERIKEINGGDYEGFHLREKMKLKDAILFIMFLKFPHLAPAFKNGESVRMLEKRTQDFLNELVKKDYKCVLVSTHGGAMRAMLNKLYDNPSKYWQGSVPLNCAVNILDVEDGKINFVTKDGDKIYYDEKYVEDLFTKGQSNVKFR